MPLRKDGGCYSYMAMGKSVEEVLIALLWMSLPNVNYPICASAWSPFLLTNLPPSLSFTGKTAGDDSNWKRTGSNSPPPTRRVLSVWRCGAGGRGGGGDY